MEILNFFPFWIKQQNSCDVTCLSKLDIVGSVIQLLNTEKFLYWEICRGVIEWHILSVYLSVCECVSVLALTESTSFEVCRGGGSSSDSSSEDSGFRFFFFPILMTIFLWDGKHIMMRWRPGDLKKNKKTSQLLQDRTVFKPSVLVVYKWNQFTCISQKLYLGPVFTVSYVHIKSPKINLAMTKISSSQWRCGCVSNRTKLYRIVFGVFSINILQRYIHCQQYCVSRSRTEALWAFWFVSV